MARNLNNITQVNGYTIQKPDINIEWSSEFKAKTNQATGNCGIFIPVYWRELIPGEKLKIEQEAVLQFTPFVTNLMHEIKGEILTYFVPYRISAFLRDEESIDGEIMQEADELKWQEYITGGITGESTLELDGLNPADIKLAFENEPNKTEQTLVDYFYNFQNVYDNITTPKKVNMLKVNAYNLIYNKQLRNPDFTKWKKTIPESFDKTDYSDEDDFYNDLKEIYTPARGYWNADRFTRARKVQLRGAQPIIPITTDEVELKHEWDVWSNHPSNFNMELNSWISRIPTSTVPTESDMRYAGIKAFIDQQGDQQNLYLYQKGGDTFGLQGRVTDADSTVFANMDPTSPSGERARAFGQLTGIHLRDHTVEAQNATFDYVDFLYNMALVKYEANNARMKPRYTDYLKYRYGVIPQDSRFNDPEWLGSYDFEVQIDTITQTAGGTPSQGQSGSNYQGNITSQAWGLNRTNNNGITYNAKEHGILLSLMIIKPIAVYEGGLEKIDEQDRTRFSFPTPEFVNLPDEKIHKSELYYTGEKDEDEKFFGWESIYDYYRTETNRVCGKLRPSDENGLYTYTLARSLPENVELNDDFLKCNPDMARIKQFQYQPDFIFFHRNRLWEALPIPLVNDPINT